MASSVQVSGDIPTGDSSSFPPSLPYGLLEQGISGPFSTRTQPSRDPFLQVTGHTFRREEVTSFLRYSFPVVAAHRANERAGRL